mgnify:CR=1 FL=1
MGSDDVIRGKYEVVIVFADQMDADRGDRIEESPIVERVRRCCPQRSILKRGGEGMYKLGPKFRYC